MDDARYWQTLEQLVSNCKLVIDRPRGSVHPRYAGFTYPYDYGYFEGTQSMDQGGIDVWVGSLPERSVTGIISTVDMTKHDAEIKILLGCTAEEAQAILQIHNEGSQAALFFPRWSETMEQEMKITRCTNPFLIGKRVYLRPFEKEDLVHIRSWANDPETRMLTGETTPMTQFSAEKFYERVQNDENRVWLMVVDKETGRVIGETGLLRIFHPWRTADLTIILGDKEAQGKGYGEETILLMLDYAFGALALHRIAIGVVGFNERALRFYEKIGFKREGIQRDGYFYNHQFSDFVMMSILEDEYRALHINR